MKSVLNSVRGGGLMARAMRSSSWLLIGYGGGQAVRLAANLMLTRLLFPEAFGMMALVGVVTIGLTLFSDVGISPSIAQSRRGDDPDFLNTAWTIQVIRGLCLWLAACALAWPVAAFYGEPDLALYLPIAGLALVLAGFNPTRIETAHRHLAIGRLTVLELSSQVIGVAVMILLAWLMQSVMALVIGGVLQAAAKLALTHLGLPGLRNRFRWERTSAAELIRFGKWIFLSTAFSFISSQGDRAILGKFLSLNILGVYNIGYFLASFPLLLAQAVTGRVLIPIYRDAPPHASPENAVRLRKIRYAIALPILGLLAAMACLGPLLVDVLYDDRYTQAGAMVVLLAVGMMPQVIGLSYDQAALAAGDSRRVFVYSCLRAVFQVGFLLIGLTWLGLIGALLGLGLASLCTHPVAIWVARHHRVWDATHDALVFGLGMALGGGALWLHWPIIVALATST